MAVQTRFIYEIADEIKADWPPAQNCDHPAGHYASVTQTSHFLVLCFPLRHDKLTTNASSGAQHICFQRSRL